MQFEAFPKMARWSRDVVITEKIDGTNAQISIIRVLPGDAVLGTPTVLRDGLAMYCGSRTRWITPADDNYGFARWAHDHADELLTLGEGQHFGEWWGSGCQRGYGLPKGEKRFSLFNTSRWAESRPACCHVVPVLYQGPNYPEVMNDTIRWLTNNGSAAAPGFMDPEGVVMFHTAANFCFKKTIKKDEAPKGLQDGGVGPARS